MRRFAKIGALILAWPFALSFSVEGHAPDTSYLRAVVSKHALELRFTFDIATLHRIERLDVDGDGKVTRAEAEKVAPEIAEFLRQKITLELNGTKAELGTLQSMGWPVDAGESVEEKNYGQTLVHFTYRLESPRKVIEDFYVLYEVFGQLGAAHRVVANIEQEDKHMEVVFTQFEPDYLYDTFWKPDAEAREQSPRTDIKERFLQGVAMVWNMGWLIAMVMLAILLLPPRRVSWWAEWIVAGGFLLWVFLILESDSAPGLFAWAFGVWIGILLVMFIAWPLRLVRSACRLGQG